MSDLRNTIVPKSDQLNADDLLVSAKTIKVTKVTVTNGEQPVTINYEGDNGKPYKPGKSMRRVLVHLWGPDGNAYVGRSMTLYCDDKVVFGGLAVGGIRISHMSHISKDVTMALTATRAKRTPFTVRPLVIKEPPSGPAVISSEDNKLLRTKLTAAKIDPAAFKQYFCIESSLELRADLMDAALQWIDEQVQNRKDTP